MNCSGSKVWSDLDSPALPDPAAFSLFRPGPSTSIMQTSQTLILSQYNFFFTIPSSPLGSKLWDPKNAVSKWAISALHHGLSIWVRCKCVNDPGQHWTQSPVSRPRCRHWWFILSILFCTITQTINEREERGHLTSQFSSGITSWCSSRYGLLFNFMISVISSGLGSSLRKYWKFL